jgi:membrane protease YdiL (CAAX protease family)
MKDIRLYFTRVSGVKRTLWIFTISWILICICSSVIRVLIPVSVELFLLIDIGIYSIPPIGILFILAARDPKILCEIGFCISRKNYTGYAELIVGIVCSPVAGAIFIALSWIVSQNLPSTPNYYMVLLASIKSDYGRLAMATYLSMSAGIIEELVFRGFLFYLLRNQFSTVWICVLSSLLFSLFHIGSGISSIAQALVFGALITGWFVYTRNLWSVMIAHGSADVIAFI